MKHTSSYCLILSCASGVHVRHLGVYFILRIEVKEAIIVPHSDGGVFGFWLGGLSFSFWAVRSSEDTSEVQLVAKQKKST